MKNNANSFGEQAARCRRLAGQLTDRDLARALLELGEEYARKAEENCRDSGPDGPILSAH